ncbi:zinc metalloprotease HtpX [Desulfoplanes formicivorans]|uniref:Protease HtpX homolog n=1 Tax=Desulfoplanes formicivorans TaxID=1592317 RepID=A0A194AF99_9BACT|nr:zinc metalloprotease HtpX [Desulfoplanes formicivorans]GAU07766.1 protease [Desulfoplanes formicivorans]
MSSQLRTGVLLAVLTALIILFGRFLGGQTGMVVAFLIAVVMNVGSYWYSDKIVLSMYRAVDLSPSDAPMIHSIVEELAQRAGLPKPRVVLVPENTPNAFATGRDPKHAVVAVTQGLLQTLSPEEIKGVLAHEMGHVKNRDILIQSVAATLAGAIMIVANMVKWATLFGFGSRDDEEGGSPLVAFVFALIAPIAASLIQMAISRSREFLADETGARLAGNPHYLANALEKLDAYSRSMPLQHGNPATENMFIVNPFAGMSVARLFSTHPPTEERVRRLRNMAP